MRQPNFGKSSFEATLGMTATVDTSNKAIDQYRLALEDCESYLFNSWYVTDAEICERIWKDTNTVIDAYYKSTEKLVDILNDFIQCNHCGVNPLADFGIYPVTFELEQGAYCGFRVVIKSVKHDALVQLYASNIAEKGTYCADGLPAGMTFDQFEACYNKLIDFCEYILIELSHLTPLKGISGGWAGGWTGREYTYRPNTAGAHKWFKPAFDMLLKRIKQANLIYI